VAGGAEATTKADVSTTGASSVKVTTPAASTSQECGGEFLIGTKTVYGCATEAATSAVKTSTSSGPATATPNAAVVGSTKVTLGILALGAVGAALLGL
jgi:hypothetical protein